MDVPDLFDQKRKKVSGLKMPRQFTPRLPGASTKGQAPINPFSGNKMKVASLRGFLEKKAHLAEVALIRERQAKTASFDPFPFFLAFIKEASINTAVQAGKVVLQGGAKAPAVQAVKSVVGGAKPTLQQVKAVVPDVTAAAKAGKGMAAGGGDLRVMGTSGKSRRKFLRKQLLAKQIGVEGAGTAGARNINTGLREGLKNVQQTGLRPVVAAPAAPRAGSSMAAHVEGVGARNATILPGRAARPGPVAPTGGSRTAQRLTEMAQKRGLDPNTVLEAHRSGGLSAAMAKIKAARPAAARPAAARPAAAAAPAELIGSGTLGKAIVGTGVVGGIGATGYGAYKGVQRGKAQNLQQQGRGFNYGM